MLTGARGGASRRTPIVWASFVAATAIVGGLLAVSDPLNVSGGGPRSSVAAPLLATNIGVLGESPSSTAVDPLFRLAAPLNRERWQGIVIHHLGAPGGDAESIHRRHLSYGFQGLGYHFLIGNGNGLGDGVIHIGYRWQDQLPGAHALGAAGDWHNHHSISICLIGNGDRRPFTERQMVQLAKLVSRLQDELGIPAGQVHLHRDISTDLEQPVTSPGRYFGAAQFRQQLR
jgi:hypothetical protein